MHKSKHSFPLYFSFRFQAISIRTLKANVSDLTLPNKIAERLISLQCDIYMPKCCLQSSFLSDMVEHNVAIVLRWSARSVLFAFLILLESFWTLHPNFSLSRGDSSGRSKNISDSGRFMCIYGAHWVSGLLTCFFWFNFEVNTKCSDIVNFAQWPHVRFSTPATGATVTWSTSVLCLLELGPSFSINNSADLILRFRRIKRQFALEYMNN